ncbi:MAG: putative sulfate/molybdate transporter [bacterium]|nr:putative sulfate/molybdate transporter [bacterium]
MFNFKIKSFEFNLRELAGSLGDFGTLFPLAIGYIVVCKLNPSGFLVMMGLVNIVSGLIYKIPMPLQPKKAVAVYAISQSWNPSMVYSCGISLGLFWLFLSFTGFIEKIVKYTPKCVVRGIQISLGIMLGFLGYSMISQSAIFIEGWGLGIISLIIIVFLQKNKCAPAAIVLLILGILISNLKGDLSGKINFSISFPSIFIPNIKEIGQAFLLAGISQIPLTLTNAVIASAALIKEYFPERAVSEKKLLINQAAMNLVVPFFGGMPMCHGAGGLAGQYYFGARTGGANIMEGLIEIFLGIFLSTSIVAIFSVFPKSIVGAMLLMVGISLLKFAKDVKGTTIEIISMIITIVISVLTKNMAIGFGSGVVFYYASKKIKTIFNKKTSYNRLTAK